MTATYAPASACGNGCLPKPGTVAQAAWHVQARRLAALLLVLISGIAVVLLIPVTTSRTRVRMKRGWFRGILRASGVTLNVRGDASLSAGAGTLVAANHVSWLDIPAVLAVEPMRVVAKSDVRDWPVIGMLAARGGAVFIDRRRLRRLPGTVADIAAALRGGYSVLVFPEGTTWCGRTLGRFYPATFQAAIDAGAPVRPVSLRYLADGSPTTAAAFLGEETLVTAVRRVVATRSLVVDLEVGPLANARGAARRSMAIATAAVIKGANPVVTHPTMVHLAAETHQRGTSEEAQKSHR